MLCDDDAVDDAVVAYVMEKVRMQQGDKYVLRKSGLQEIKQIFHSL